MAGIYKLDILESEAELHALLRQQKTVSGKERVQVLYLLKTQKAKTIEEKIGIEAKYKTVHKLVYYRLKASPKVARPKSLEQSEERLEAFKKTS